MRAIMQLRLKSIAFSLLFISLMIPGKATAADELAIAPTYASTEYLIGLGDVLEIQVWKEPELTRPLTVRLDGRISLPLVGDIVAANKSPETLARDLEEKLKTYIAEPSVTVILQQSTSRRYYILGKIVNAGEFNIDTPLTILQVLARSGGFQEWAKKDKIMIIRSEGEKEKFLTFNYEALIEDGDISQNIEIAPGDTIIVP